MRCARPSPLWPVPTSPTSSTPWTPAHAAFGGYEQSAIGRENHEMTFDHHQRTKSLMVSYGNEAQGFF